MNTKNPCWENPFRSMNKSLFSRIDWISMLLYLGLVIFGITNIYSTTFDNIPLELFNPSTAVGKQVLFFVLCFICWLPILFVNPNFFDRFALILYVKIVLFCLSVTLLNFIPVYYIKKCIDIIWSAVLII